MYCCFYIFRCRLQEYVVSSYKTAKWLFDQKRIVPTQNIQVFACKLQLMQLTFAFALFVVVVVDSVDAVITSEN